MNRSQHPVSAALVGGVRDRILRLLYDAYFGVDHQAKPNTTTSRSSIDSVDRELPNPSHVLRPLSRNAASDRPSWRSRGRRVGDGPIRRGPLMMVRDDGTEDLPEHTSQPDRYPGDLPAPHDGPEPSRPMPDQQRDVRLGWSSPEIRRLE